MSVYISYARCCGLALHLQTEPISWLFQTTISTCAHRCGQVIVAALHKTAQFCRIFNHSGKINLLQHELNLEDLAYLITKTRHRNIFCITL